MVKITPYATAKVAVRNIVPGVELLQSTEVTMKAVNSLIELGDIIHIPQFHGSIENHIKKSFL